LATKPTFAVVSHICKRMDSVCHRHQSWGLGVPPDFRMAGGWWWDHGVSMKYYHIL